MAPESDHWLLEQLTGLGRRLSVWSTELLADADHFYRPPFDAVITSVTLSPDTKTHSGRLVLNDS